MHFCAGVPDVQSSNVARIPCRAGSNWRTTMSDIGVTSNAPDFQNFLSDTSGIADGGGPQNDPLMNLEQEIRAILSLVAQQLASSGDNAPPGGNNVDLSTPAAGGGAGQPAPSGAQFVPGTNAPTASTGHGSVNLNGFGSLQLPTGTDGHVSTVGAGQL